MIGRHWPLLYFNPVWVPTALWSLPLARYVRTTHKGCRFVSPHRRFSHAKAQKAALSLLARRYHIHPLSPIAYNSDVSGHTNAAHRLYSLGVAATIAASITQWVPYVPPSVPSFDALTIPCCN
jgi:hypothetical protein